MISYLALVAVMVWAARAAVQALTMWRKEMRVHAPVELGRKLLNLGHQSQEDFLRAQRAPLEPAK